MRALYCNMSSFLTSQKYIVYFNYKCLLTDGVMVGTLGRYIGLSIGLRYLELNLSLDLSGSGVT